MSSDSSGIEMEEASGVGIHVPTPEQWYALYVQVNHEKEVTKRLEQKEVSCFLPLMETWSKRRDRRKKVQLPMFPGYVFVHVLLDSSANLTIVKTPGALSPTDSSTREISSYTKVRQCNCKNLL